MFSRIRRGLPPARLVWILVAGLGAYGAWTVGTGAVPLVVLPATAALLDLTYARIRFPTLRVPDSALATGVIVAVVLPPTVSLPLAGMAIVVAISIKHIVRVWGHPLVNPAVAGILFAALLGVPPAWWASISPELVVALGVALLLWVPRAWRLTVPFLAVYAGLAILTKVLFASVAGGLPPPGVLVLTAVDPAILFFAFFMVSEPQAAVSDPGAQPLYATVVAGGASLLPLIGPTVAPILALAGGNLLAVALRRRAAGATPASSRREERRTRSRPAPAGRSRAPRPLADRWPVRRRIAAGAVVGIALAIALPALMGSLGASAAGGLPPGSSSGPPGSGPSACAADNPTIPPSTLSALHRILGPSVILSYNAGTGTVVFYDPVNHVTVTETDLYEDFGYAEFNGDDFAVAGCAP
ncbi:MAG: RnfABCDGE type electron transport complex subunit D [Thermoplasmata archaeon]